MLLTYISPISNKITKNNTYIPHCHGSSSFAIYVGFKPLFYYFVSKCNDMNPYIIIFRKYNEMTY